MEVTKPMMRSTALRTVVVTLFHKSVKNSRNLSNASVILPGMEVTKPMMCSTALCTGSDMLSHKNTMVVFTLPGMEVTKPMMRSTALRTVPVILFHRSVKNVRTLSSAMEILLGMEVTKPMMPPTAFPTHETTVETMLKRRWNIGLRRLSHTVFTSKPTTAITAPATMATTATTFITTLIAPQTFSAIFVSTGLIWFHASVKADFRRANKALRRSHNPEKVSFRRANKRFNTSHVTCAAVFTYCHALLTAAFTASQVPNTNRRKPSLLFHSSVTRPMTAATAAAIHPTMGIFMMATLMALQAVVATPLSHGKNPPADMMENFMISMFRAMFTTPVFTNFTNDDQLAPHHFTVLTTPLPII